MALLCSRSLAPKDLVSHSRYFFWGEGFLEGGGDFGIYDFLLCVQYCFLFSYYLPSLAAASVCFFLGPFFWNVYQLIICLFCKKIFKIEIQMFQICKHICETLLANIFNYFSWFLQKNLYLHGFRTNIWTKDDLIEWAEDLL